jgi:sterol 3beta-glucosyltransferase
VRQAGVRALLAMGWGGLAKIEVPESVHMIGSAPHHALFPLMSAVVHHGGAGSTAAGLRAGRPTLVCPLAVDQPFWGYLVNKMGCGPKPQPMNRLKAERFAEGLRELTGTESYRVRAREVAGAIAKEDGVARAIEVIEGASRR